MVNKYVGAGQAIFGVGKKIIQKLSGQGKTTGKEVINPFKANPQTKESIHKINLAKIPGQVKRKYGDMVTDTDEAARNLRQVYQKITGKKVTESGVSKGKDLKVEKKAKGGRIGYRRGTPKRQTNIQKIKKTFGPKGLGMQSVIYGLDKNPKITAADPKAKFIAANKKKKKV